MLIPLRHQHDTMVQSGGSHIGPRLVMLFICLIALVGQLAIWPQVIASRGGIERYVREATDFAPTLTAARIIRLGLGQDLYNRDVQHRVQQTVVAPYATLREGFLNIYNHPPVEALLIAPLTDLPFSTVFWIWVGFSVVIALAALLALQVALPLPRRALPLALLAAISFHPLVLSIWLGQNTALVLLGFCGVALGLRRDQPVLIAVALLPIALKPQLLPPVIGFLIVARCYRALGFAALLAAFGMITLMPLLGWRWPAAYLRFLAIDSNLGAAVAEKPYIMTNWRGLVVNLLGEEPHAAVTAATLLLTALSLGVFFFVFWRINRRGWHPQTNIQTERDTSTTMHFFALTCIIALLIAPHLNPHDLAILIVPAWIMVHFSPTYRLKGAQTVSRFLVGIGYLLPIATLYATSDYFLPVVSLVLLLICAAAFFAPMTIGSTKAVPQIKRGAGGA